jgi:hypothetical protein
MPEGELETLPCPVLIRFRENVLGRIVIVTVDMAPLQFIVYAVVVVIVPGE